jgi:uncharacterized protein
VIVVDSGPLVAAVLGNDDDHRACVDLFAAAHLNREQLVVPSFVIPEVCYLIQREVGAKVEADFVESLAAGDFTVDRRHFSVVRPRHLDAFVLLP